jgi:hypothetical protein
MKSKEEADLTNILKAKNPIKNASKQMCKSERPVH